MPYLSSTLFVVSLVTAIAASIVGSCLAVRSLWPAFSGRTEQAFSARPGRSVAVGLPALLVAILVAVALVQVPGPAARLSGLIVLAVVVALVLGGLSGVAARVGRGLGDGTEGVVVRRGGVVLLLFWLLPVLGWFVVAPLTLAAALGAAIHALVSRAPLAHPVPRAHAANAIGARA